MIKKYPVGPKSYTKEEAPYVYTEYAEQFTKERPHLETRTAGTIACFAGEPLRDGMTARTWLDAGFVAKR